MICRLIFFWKVLMVSFMGPQHVRIIHAYYDGAQQQLVIHHAARLSFERFETVEISLVLRFLLSELVT